MRECRVVEGVRGEVEGVMRGEWEGRLKELEAVHGDEVARMKAAHEESVAGLSMEMMEAAMDREEKHRVEVEGAMPFPAATRTLCICLPHKSIP